MPTCHVTGIEIHLSESFVLCAPVAARLLHRRMHQVRLLEMLLKEYGHMVSVQTMDSEGFPINRRQARLVCEAIADAWSEEVEGSQDLFMPFTEWCARGRARKITRAHQPRPENPEAMEAAHDAEQ